MQIFHNPRCRKSRETLELITDQGIEPEIILYLDKPPTQKRLKEILAMLNISAAKLVRKSEPAYKENFKGKELSEAEWIKAMILHPKLIERPIVIKDNKAVLGRPPENVTELF